MSNKVIIGVDYGSYTFDASAKEITLSGVNTVIIEQFLLIVNLVDQQIIYSPVKIGYGGTVSGNVITLDYDTTLMSDTDELQIYFALDNSTDIFPTQISGTVSVDTSLLATSAKQDLLLTELQAKADLSETQPVSLASIPLPTGASTEATLIEVRDYLDTVETKLQSIITNTTGVNLEATQIQVRDYLDTVETKLQSLITALGTPFQAGGSIGNTSFIANAGTNLNTSALSLEATQQLLLTALNDIKTYTDGIETLLTNINSKDFATQTTLNTLLKPADTLTKVTTVDTITNPVAVTGPLTDAQLRATPVPISGTITATVDTTLLATVAEQQTQTDFLNRLLPNLDAFSRLRISNPVTVFDSQFTYDLQPLLFEQIAIAPNATITHDSTNRCALLSLVGSLANSNCYMQSFEHIRYQPSKSQLGFISFNFIEHVPGCRKFVGYGNIAGNCIQLRQETNGVWTFNIFSDTDEGDFAVSQTLWNLDRLDGLGILNPSGVTLDKTKTQLFVFDFQALYVGTVRFGFSIAGDVIWCHEEHHTNIAINPYIQSANQPIIAGMRAVSTAGINTTMKFICSAIVSEGGQDETTGYDFAQSSGPVAIANGVDTHVLSLRPSLTFNGITNRVKFIDFEYEIAVRGNSAIEYKIVLGQDLSGTTTFLNHNATYSAMDYNILGTLSGSPAIVIDAGEVFSSASQKGGVTKKVSFRYPITLDYLGAVRSLGTISLIAQGVSGNTTVRGILKWREIR
jgi:hypothetical protein